MSKLDERKTTRETQTTREKKGRFSRRLFTKGAAATIVASPVLAEALTPLKLFIPGSLQSEVELIPGSHTNFVFSAEVLKNGFSLHVIGDSIPAGYQYTTAQGKDVYEPSFADIIETELSGVAPISVHQHAFQGATSQQILDKLPQIKKDIIASSKKKPAIIFISLNGDDFRKLYGKEKEDISTLTTSRRGLFGGLFSKIGAVYNINNTFDDEQQILQQNLYKIVSRIDACGNEGAKIAGIIFLTPPDFSQAESITYVPLADQQRRQQIKIAGNPLNKQAAFNVSEKVTQAYEWAVTHFSEYPRGKSKFQVNTMIGLEDYFNGSEHLSGKGHRQLAYKILKRWFVQKENSIPIDLYSYTHPL